MSGERNDMIPLPSWPGDIAKLRAEVAELRAELAERDDEASEPSDPSGETMTAPEVAKFLRMGRNKVYELTNTGALPCRFVDGRRKYSRSEVEAWLRTSTLSQGAALKKTKKGARR
jgi:excisionase family DNA binding protein